MDSTAADSIDLREMATRIEAQRHELFKASAVVAVCRQACASKFDEFDSEHIADALVVVHDLIDDVACTLETLARERGS